MYLCLKRRHVISVKQSDTYRSESAFIKNEPVGTTRSDNPIAGWGELFFFLNQYRGKSKNGLGLLLLIESSKRSLNNNYSPKT